MKNTFHGLAQIELGVRTTVIGVSCFRDDVVYLSSSGNLNNFIGLICLQGPI